MTELLLCTLAKLLKLLTQTLCLHSQAPYTKALLASIPKIEFDRDFSDREVLEGEVPSPLDPPSGCSFHPRCKLASDICRKESPQLKMSESGQSVSCHNVSV